MQTELSPEQLQAICLTDGSNTFTAMAGKTPLEKLKWPYLIRMRDFKEEREAFEKLYDQAMQETSDNGTPNPDTVVALLEKKSDIDQLVAGTTLSSKADLRTTEMKWRAEAKNYLAQLTETLNNYSNHDAARLKKYAFSGKTVGDLLEHMVSKGLRFANPAREDRNLYASVFFLMRYAFKDSTPPVGVASKGESGTSAIASVPKRCPVRAFSVSINADGTKCEVSVDTRDPAESDNDSNTEADAGERVPSLINGLRNAYILKLKDGRCRVIHDFSQMNDLADTFWLYSLAIQNNEGINIDHGAGVLVFPSRSLDNKPRITGFLAYPRNTELPVRLKVVLNDHHGASQRPGSSSIAIRLGHYCISTSVVYLPWSDSTTFTVSWGGGARRHLCKHCSPSAQPLAPSLRRNYRFPR